MAFLNRPLSGYFQQLRIGLILLLIVAAVRFVAKPALGLDYVQVTHFMSLFWLVFILLAVYGVVTGRAGGNWKDYLANALILAAGSQIIIAVAIAVDEFLGIDTFYTDLAHGGSQSALAHMAGHLIPATIVLTIIGLLWGWLCGTVARLLFKPA